MENTKKLLVVLVLLALLLIPTHSAYAWNRSLDGQVVFGQDFTLKSGDTLNGDLVVIGGQATIEDSAMVKGNVVIIGGSLSLDGQVTGDAVVIGGLVSMGEKSLVAGDVVTMGGTLQRATGAEIGGNVVTNLPAPNIQILGSTNVQIPPSVTLPPRVDINFDPFWAVAGVFFRALAVAMLAMLLTIFLHPQLDRVAQAIVSQPVMAGGMGLLTTFLAPVALVILVVTLILIPVALAAAILLVLAWLFGVIALGMEVGDRFTQAIHQTWAPVLSSGFGTFMLMIAVGAVNLVPCIGWLAGVLVGLVGIGAVVMTMFGTRTVFRPGILPPMPPVDPGAAPSQPLPPAS